MNGRSRAWRRWPAWPTCGVLIAALSLTPASGAAGQTFRCGAVPAPIPDNDTTGVTLDCPVSGFATALGSVQVTLTLSPAHTFTGDLDADLAPPGATPGTAGSFILFDAFDDFSILDAVMAGPYTLTDVAGTNFLTAASASNGATIPAGVYRTAEADENVSTSLNEAFGGIPASAVNGTWRLRMRDLFEGDIGTISAASITLAPPSIVAAVLPTSRSVRAPNGVASAFATIINNGAADATNCRISPRTSVPGAFVYQTTNVQNQLVGSPDTPATIAAGEAQSFFFAFTPSDTFGPADVRINFVCDQSAGASVTGLTTLALVASTTPVPDIIALAATVNNNGILDIVGALGAPAAGNGVGAFAVATSNVGAGGAITVSADTGGASLPLVLTVCETGPSGCLKVPAPTITVQMAAGQTSTFSVFGQAMGAIPFDPANSRVFVRFKDNADVIRGSTSTAVRTVP